MNEEIDDKCPICFESKNSKIFVSIPCQTMNHELCLQCFIHLNDRKCPLCRTDFNSQLPDIKDETRILLIDFLSSYNDYKKIYAEQMTQTTYASNEINEA